MNNDVRDEKRALFAFEGTFYLQRRSSRFWGQVCSFPQEKAAAELGPWAWVQEQAR